MTPSENFNKYFRRKLLLWGSVATIAILIRHFTKPDISFLFIFGFISFTIIITLILGLRDYIFYEKQAPKIVLKLLDKSPLKDFTKLGFIKEDNNKIVGKINDFQVSLAPLTTSNRENSLLILIPLKLQEGLENYFTSFDNHFKFRLSENILFAEAILSNYDKSFDFEKLNSLLIDTTQNLKNKNIQMLEVHKDN
jgi:hypothetical protein